MMNNADFEKKRGKITEKVNKINIMPTKNKLCNIKITVVFLYKGGFSGLKTH